MRKIDKYKLAAKRRKEIDEALVRSEGLIRDKLIAPLFAGAAQTRPPLSNNTIKENKMIQSIRAFTAISYWGLGYWAGYLHEWTLIFYFMGGLLISWAIWGRHEQQ